MESTTVSSILLLSFFVSSIESYPLLHNFTALTGSVLTLPYKGHDRPFKFEWRLRDLTKVAISDPSTGVTYPTGPLKGRVHLNDSALIVTSLRLNDTGTYTILSEDSTGTEIGYSYYVEVREPMQAPTLYTDRYNDSSAIRLTCQASNNLHRNITYHWKTDVIQATNSTRSIILHIEDYMSVTCTVTDGVSKNSITIMVPLRDASYGLQPTIIFLSVLCMILIAAITVYFVKKHCCDKQYKITCINPYRECFGAGLV
ncbi:ORF11 [Fowl aviadenovirus 3]|uniref:ORF11 n=1 Tax=Fowl aviadenovirus 3 TaxID=172860 RepID=A0A191ULN6_9ADEN|nr:ORF11 [Fowl aviadenovirus 3]